MKRKIAIVGASSFQNPLILKAKEMGLETHVFAWACGDVGEQTADVFHPVSITEIDRIADICKEVGVEGICSIGTDLGNITVSKVAAKLGLNANPVECVDKSTNKHRMREAFFANGDPSPKSVLVRSIEDLEGVNLSYPLIVKPVDRSGSRCISKLDTPEGLEEAVLDAVEASFDKSAVVEEFFVGTEYSVEFISWQGEHTFLALTKKYTTGAPHFIETGHLEPAPVSSELCERIKGVVVHALDGLGVEYGASHSEVLVSESGDIRIVEIGSRMGGDCIGSDLVYLSTGIDFVRAVIDIALGVKPDLSSRHAPGSAMIRFMFTEGDRIALEQARASHLDLVKRVVLSDDANHEIVDSSSRYGYFILSAPHQNDLAPYLPERR